MFAGVRSQDPMITDTPRRGDARTAWLVLTSVLVGVGCGVTDASAPDLAIEMSTTAFMRVPSTQSALIPFQLRSNDSVTVYVPGCGRHPVLTLQQRTSAGWQDTPAVLGCIGSSGPIALLPHAVLADTLRCPQVGTFRLTVAYSLSASEAANMAVPGPSFTVQ